MLKLGCYLGPSNDISPAKNAKNLTENRQVLHRSQYRLLTPEAVSKKDGSDAQEQFMARVFERLGSWVIPRENEDIRLENTLQYDLYEDETKNKQSLPQ